MKFTHVHKPTGRPCRIISLHRSAAVIDLGPGASNPFPRVDLGDLLPINDQRQARTDKLLARLKGQTTEFAQLHTLLCMSHGLSGDDYTLAESVFDGMRLANRLDDLNQAARAQFLTHA